MMSANYLRISGYFCKVCEMEHNEDDEDGLFSEHFAENHPAARPLTFDDGHKAGKQEGKRKVVDWVKSRPIKGVYDDGAKRVRLYEIGDTELEAQLK